MNQYFYSPSKRGFYNTQTPKNYIPEDVVEITETYWKDLLALQSRGKVIQPNEEGYPVAVNYEHTITWEQIRQQRDDLLKRSDWVVLEDSNPKPSKEAWLEYRQALREVPQNFSSPDKVTWPLMP